MFEILMEFLGFVVLTQGYWILNIISPAHYGWKFLMLTSIMHTNEWMFINILAKRPIIIIMHL